MTHHIVSKENLDEKLMEAGTNLVVIDFHAQWCGPCKLIEPKLEELAAEHPEVVFLKVDFDQCEDLAVAYKISAMPTFVFLKQGKTIDSFQGVSYEKLKEVILKLK